jgi:hypothetical protein
MVVLVAMEHNRLQKKISSIKKRAMKTQFDQYSYNPKKGSDRR